MPAIYELFTKAWRNMDFYFYVENPIVSNLITLRILLNFHVFTVFGRTRLFTAFTRYTLICLE